MNDNNNWTRKGLRVHVKWMYLNKLMVNNSDLIKSYLARNLILLQVFFFTLHRLHIIVNQ